MSVNFDVTNCKDFYKHFPDQGPENDRQWNGLFFALTMVMLAIGPPPKTEDDTKGFDEFWFRIKTYEKVIGPLASRSNDKDEREDVLVTKEQLKALIGLRINVSPVSATKFNGWLMRCLRAEHDRAERRS